MHADAWQELSTLPPSQHLVEHGDYLVIAAPGAQIPHLLEELGRCRARTFQAAGMGSEAELDLDRYDPHYTQLLLIDREQRALAGGYRLTRCRERIAEQGVEGIYNASLFDFDPTFVTALDGAIELGRSFVCPEYQRALRPLALLWSGVGAFIALEPGRDYVLFGAVSVPATMSVASQASILEHLRTHHFDAQLGQGVHGRTPPAFEIRPAAPPRTLGELERALRAADPNAHVPVLIKRYLQLGGRFVGFNEDADFGSSLDCLVWVDLRDTSPRRLRAYVGEQTQRVLQGVELAVSA